MQKRMLQIACVAVGALVLMPAAFAGPKMQLSMDVWSIGEMNQNESRTTSVQIKNEGDAPLVMSKILAGCASCTTATADSMTVEPGKSTELHVTFNSRNYSGDIARSVQILSNDPETPSKEFRIQVKIKDQARPRLQIDPVSVDLGVLQAGESRQVTVRLKNTGAGPLNVKGFYNSPNLKARVEGDSVVPPGETRNVILTVGPYPNQLPVHEYAFVQSDDPLGGGVSVQVRGRVATASSAGGLTIQPRGTPVTVPGSEMMYYQKYDVTNSFPFPVVIERGGPEAKQLSVLVAKTSLAPGETTGIKVVAKGGMDEQTLKDSLHFTITWPLTFGKPTEAAAEPEGKTPPEPAPAK